MFPKCCLLLPLMALSIAAPVDDIEIKGITTTTPIVNILESETIHSEDGAYSWSYRSEDGTMRREDAVLINPGKKNQYLQITGSYSYFDATGKEVVVTYVADNKGFVPEGSHIQPEVITAVKQNSELGPYTPEKVRKNRQMDVDEVVRELMPPLVSSEESVAPEEEETMTTMLADTEDTMEAEKED